LASLQEGHVIEVHPDIFLIWLPVVIAARQPCRLLRSSYLTKMGNNKTLNHECIKFSVT